MSAVKTVKATESPVHSDPEIMGGVPIFVGTRVPAQTLFDYLGDNCNLDEFLANFPSVSREQALQLLDQAREAILHTSSRLVTERWGRLEEMDRSFDIQFWQAQEPAARLAAVWELAVTAYAIKGQDIHALRLARHIESFQPLQG